MSYAGAAMAPPDRHVRLELQWPAMERPMAVRSVPAAGVS